MRGLILALVAFCALLIASTASATPYFIVRDSGMPAYDYGVPGDSAIYASNYRDYYSNYYPNSYTNYAPSYSYGYPYSYYASLYSPHINAGYGYGPYGYGVPRANYYSLSSPATPNYSWYFGTHNMPWCLYGYDTPYYYGTHYERDYYDYVYTDPYIYVEYRG